MQATTLHAVTPLRESLRMAVTILLDCQERVGTRGTNRVLPFLPHLADHCIHTLLGSYDRLLEQNQDSLLQEDQV